MLKRTTSKLRKFKVRRVYGWEKFKEITLHDTTDMGPGSLGQAFLHYEQERPRLLQAHWHKWVAVPANATQKIQLFETEEQALDKQDEEEAELEELPALLVTQVGNEFIHVMKMR
eukprot:TRINITY_DN87411_c0_g1_i1.p2 TRINITY_DN87411_c0_g1~~TRINITY_DN87411_c0_g1_i1.p2  ORF type:complete len:115 (-),score=12.46 TRINITY_DN87411_c0_g1_i1:158-502(-)